MDHSFWGTRGRHRLGHLATGLGLCASVACAPPARPVYDDTIDVQAVSAEPGSLSGTFAVKSTSATLVRIPVPGIEDQMGGGVNYRWVNRVWDEAEQHYVQESRLCGGLNFEVAGVTTGAPASTYRAVPPSTQEVVTVDHALGTYLVEGHVQLWGIELPDPLSDSMPLNAEEAAEAPHVDRIYDMDEDGHDGITLFVSGIVSGQVWAVQRKSATFEGVLQPGGRTVGILETGYETVVLGDDIAIYDPDLGSSEAWPDPKESWFEEIPLPPGSDCDDVMRAAEDGALSRLRPF